MRDIPKFAPMPVKKPGLWRATPPAIFPPVMGLFGLGLAWRRGVDAFGFPGGVAELLLGAVSLLFLFCLIAYAVKLMRRPKVVLEDLRILPGRAGLAAMVLSLLLLAATLVPYVPGIALVLLWAGLALHLGLAGLLLHNLLSGPEEARVLTPVWHLSFVGFIVGGIAAVPLGLASLAQALFAATLPLAIAIWVLSAMQLLRRVPPAPLRPLLAIHLAPAALLGSVALLTGFAGLAQAFAMLGGAILIALLLAGRWITAAGFSPLWGAFTFPLAAYAGLLLALDGVWPVLGALVLIVATLAIPPIAFRILKLWAQGALAIKTNAAIA